MSYFTIKSSFFPYFSDKILYDFKKIDELMYILEESGVGKILEYVKCKNKMCQGRIGYNPYNLFATIVYCFAKFKASLRDIEDKCIYDVRVMYIMEGKTPDHSVIGDFINNYIVPYQFEIFTLINKQIIKSMNINIIDCFVDGTKIEANANKYKFVWKPRKFHKNLNDKILLFLEDINCQQKFDEYIKSAELLKILNDYVAENNIDVENIPFGRGKRRTKEQRNYKLGFSYLEKLLEYEEKENICGENRNSYYKTDYSATAMALKADYYSGKGSNMHAAYNVQILVSSLLVLMYGIYQDRSDYYTLIPLLDNYYKYYGEYPVNLCADSGYGIYLNYLYIKKNNIGNYVKFLQWNGEANGKRPQLFKLNENLDFVCLNNCVGKVIELKKKHHLKDSEFYEFSGCQSCNFTHKCKNFLNDEKKNDDYRIKELSVSYEILKDEARSNLLSPYGIQIRINRSIQVEGTFGQMKQNMMYQRFRRRGLESVSAEIMLECLGINIRRFISSNNNKKFKQNCWKDYETLQPEVFPKCKEKRSYQEN